MAFERFVSLGEERFDKIINALTRGTPALRLAREIQQQPPEGWGLFQDVAESSLMVQLCRLRTAIAEGVFSKRIAKQLAAGTNTPKLGTLQRVSVQVLSRMEDLADQHKQRVENFLLKEKTQPLPSRTMTEAMTEYRETLERIQKIRFELGLDEYKGPTGSSTTIRGASQTTMFPDGMSVQKQVFEAVQTVEKILDARKIPRRPDRLGLNPTE